MTATATRRGPSPSPLSLLGGSSRRGVPRLRLRLLGGFGAERVGVDWPVAGWQRRSAKTLTKLLATCPGHSLHREQLLDILWPGAELESALNSFGKALHAARHALEPELMPRESSAYLRLTDSLVALDAENVWIDADHFEHLAQTALRQGGTRAYESALAAYAGELLPEDRYEDWCARRRDYLAELHIRLLEGLAEELAARGSHSAAAARFREVLELDPTREDVHRRLMDLYVSAGARDQAVRQFHICQDVLKRELDLAPGQATQALYEKIVTGASPFVTRASLLRQLGAQLTAADAMHESARRVLALVAAAPEARISLTDLRIGAAALRPRVSEVALFDALDRALELRILDERDGVYAFRHPLIRSALYEDLSKHRRDELHAALTRSRAGHP